MEKSEEGVDELVWDTSILGGSSFFTLSRLTLTCDADAIGKDGLDVAMKWETEFKFKYRKKPLASSNPNSHPFQLHRYRFYHLQYQSVES